MARYTHFEVLTPENYEVLCEFTDEELARKVYKELSALVDCELIFHAYRLMGE